MSAELITLFEFITPFVITFLCGWLVGFGMGWNRSYAAHCTKRVRS